MDSDANPTVNLGEWEIMLEARDINYDKGKEPKETYFVSTGFETYYTGETTEKGSFDHIPNIWIDSVCVNMPTSGQLQCTTITLTGKRARLTWFDGGWHGPQFGAGFTIPFADSMVTVSFVAILSDRVSGAELKRKEYSLDLKRFYKPYRILMQ